MDLVARAVEEARVDEDHAISGGQDAAGEIDGGAALLVHDAHLQGEARHAHEILDAGEEVIGQRHLVGTVHLRLDDIDRARTRILHLLGALEIVLGDERGHGGVNDAFGRVGAVHLHHVGVHVMADIARQHEAAAREPERLAIGTRIAAIRVEATLQRAARLLEAGGQRAIHQAEPVAIDEHLVLGVDSRDRVFHIHDGGDGGFQHDVADPRRIGLADGAGAVEAQLRMQAMVDEEHQCGRVYIAIIARKARGILQAGGRATLEGDDKRAVDDGVAGGVRMAAGRERSDGVEHLPRLGDDLGAAGRVVALATRRIALVGDRVGAIERVIEAAPAGVGGVQRIAGVGHGHDQLRPGDAGDGVVHILGADGGGGGLGQEIADLAQEGLVSDRVMGLALVGHMPGVDLALQIIAHRQQRRRTRGKISENGGEAAPEDVGREARAGQRFGIHEVIEFTGDAEACG